MAKVILVTGGCRSGKSQFAEHLALSASEIRRYIATCPVCDGEMAERVRRHRERRSTALLLCDGKPEIRKVLQHCLNQRVIVLHGEHAAVGQIDFAIALFDHKAAAHQRIQHPHDRRFGYSQRAGHLL